MALYHSYNCPVRTVNMQRILRSLTALPCLVMAGGGGGGGFSDGQLMALKWTSLLKRLTHVHVILMRNNYNTFRQ